MDSSSFLTAQEAEPKDIMFREAGKPISGMISGSYQLVSVFLNIKLDHELRWRSFKRKE